MKLRKFLKHNYSDVNAFSYDKGQHLKYLYNWNYTSNSNGLGIDQWLEGISLHLVCWDIIMFDSKNQNSWRRNIVIIYENI